jgi:ribosomal protein S8
MIKNSKKIMCKIRVAQSNNKKFLIIKNINKLNFLLNFLWASGIIYGYAATCQSKSFKIFLKYSKNGVSTVQNLVFLNKLVKKSKLGSLSILEKNTTFLIINDRGLHKPKFLNKKGLGGKIFAKI